MSEFIQFGNLFDAARDRKAVVAFRGGVPIDLGSFERQVRAWYAAFVTAPGRRYVLHSADALEFAAALLGAWHARKCVLVPSDAQVYSVSQSGVCIDGFAGTPDGLACAPPTTEGLPPLDPDVVLLEMFTSGSTGHPVAIPKCLRQLEQEAAALAAAFDLGPPSRRVLGTVSHQHMYGIMFRVLLPMTTGRPFESTRLEQVQDLACASASESCVLVSSPAQLARLSKMDSFIGHVAAVLSAGGPLADDSVQDCARIFRVDVTEIYGSSETGAVAWRVRTPGRTPPWHPFRGVEFRSEDGVLGIRTQQLPTNDWFCSADRIVQTAGGFELVGRVDRIVKLEERRVSLDAVERLLLATGLLYEARALVLDGPRRILAIAARPNAAGWALAEISKRSLVDELRAALRRAAEIGVQPRSWRFTDPWPITADGKTPEAVLRERFDRAAPEFRLLQQDGDACVADLWVSPTAPCFQGHFPGHPVLPGVVQIDWLVRLSRELLNVKADFEGLEAAKFRRVIQPNAWVRVVLRHDDTTSRTSYRISRGEEPCASGRIRWSAGA